jgi:hypothetical protein
MPWPLHCPIGQSSRILTDERQARQLPTADIRDPAPATGILQWTALNGLSIVTLPASAFKRTP